MWEAPPEHDSDTVTINDRQSYEKVLLTRKFLIIIILIRNDRNGVD